MPLPHIINRFNKRFEEGLQIIRECGIPFKEAGIFGSYARGDYGPDSDIDFCLIFKDNESVPGIDVVYPVRDKLDMIGCDLIGTTVDRFKTENTAFYKNLRKDYRRCDIEEK